MKMSATTHVSESAMTNSWFALHVKSRHEKMVSSILSGKGYEQLLPVYRSNRKWIDREREIDLPLFPGYVFCKFSLDARIGVVTTPGVVNIVRCGGEFAPVDPAEIAALRAVMKSHLPARPWQYLASGEQVMIEGGPLHGVIGILLQTKNSKRVVLRVTALCRSVSVEIDGEQIVPYPPRFCIRAFCPDTGRYDEAAQAT